MADSRRWGWLPPVGSWKYHALLGAIGMLVLGPLGGVTASYMNFSLGFFVGGQVLAGILGSVVTYGYGAEGKHGANYIQTAAASVAGMAGMGVVIQAMVWMGLPQPPLWQLVLYMLCIGMFGAGVGMLYTLILVDRLRLSFPSGWAVANILRALTDPVLLRRSVSRLFGGMGLGVAGGIAAGKVAAVGALGLSVSTLGAGMVVGARIGIPALTAGLLSDALVPQFVWMGWLQDGEPFRKITFLLALGMILGAAIVDLAVIGVQTVRHLRQDGPAEAGPEPWQRANVARLLVWTLLWGGLLVWVGSSLLHAPVGFMLFALALVFVFGLVNGICVGVSDSNPISSAFVVTVVLLALLGLKDPLVGLLSASVLLVATGVACDMQQDRSTGWRLGTNRTMQFRYQAAGLVVGALAAVGFARLFMTAYPVLALDQTTLSASQQAGHWTSAMTYKIVGSLHGLSDPKPYQTTAILLGMALGFAVELARKCVMANRRYRQFAASGKAGFATDFAVDVLVLPSPYAFSFGGFVNLQTSLWFAGGGVLASVLNTVAPKPGEDDLPSDMSSTSLLGGGLIAGDALAALGLGLAGLAVTLLG